ncbi:MAG: hypothetical protein DME19_05725 [Verrucomicrobia bacterium]|nr:MAG: hypothetical protein DME19_05725 [Verrucomicrobiota bacterium]
MLTDWAKEAGENKTFVSRLIAKTEERKAEGQAGARSFISAVLLVVDLAGHPKQVAVRLRDSMSDAF